MNSSLESYPDPLNFNLNDTHEQEMFLQQYQAAQEHDPQVKYAIFIFYAILVSTALLLMLDKPFVVRHEIDSVFVV